MSMPPGSVGRRIATVLVAVGLLAPATAVGATPSLSPPGPWAKNPAPSVPYRPPASVRCVRSGDTEVRGATLLAVFVDGPSCAQGRELARAYAQCIGRSLTVGTCRAQQHTRCAQEVLLGGCRLTVTSLTRRQSGWECAEERLYEVDARYEANVTCTSGAARRVTFSWTLFDGRPVTVVTESDLRAAWANPRVTEIALTRDILLRACRVGDPIRESSGPITLLGNGHALRQGCFEKRVLRQDGTGLVVLRHVKLSHGGTDGPGAAVTTRGEIHVYDSIVEKNLSEEPGGGIFSMRRALIVRSVITGNLANDDGGGVYARRGGIEVYDSTVSGNLVDGSGGALASTGDILVVRSHVDGNTTDGDGGAIYADETGDVTVVHSTVDGSTADGPGGAIFTVDGDVTVVGSTLNGNRADDRGGAIAGEGDVLVLGSTIVRNAAVAHVGGGVWARGDLYLANSTVSNNYAEGEGGGVFAAGTVTLAYATIADNFAPDAANVGAGAQLAIFGSVIGPAKLNANGGGAQPTSTNCHVTSTRSLGYNVASDGSCRLAATTDLEDAAAGGLGALGDSGGPGETLVPGAASAALDRIPAAACASAPASTMEPGRQHLSGLVDLVALMRLDERGTGRPQGAGCDAGAVEVAR